MDPHETLIVVTQLATFVFIACLADEYVKARREWRKNRRAK